MIIAPHLPTLHAALDPDSVAQALQQVLSSSKTGKEVVDCRVSYIQYPPTTSCAILYDVTLHEQGQVAHHRFVGHVFSNDHACHAMLKRRRVRELADRYREIVEPPRLELPVFHLPSLRMVMEAFPMDYRLPWIIQLTSRDQASRLVRHILRRPIEDLQIKILRYKAGKKIALKYQFRLPGAETQNSQVTVKASSARTLNALSYHTLMSRLRKVAEGKVRLEATQGCLPEFSLVLSAWLPGRPLANVKRDPDFLKHVAAAAEALVHFHALAFQDAPRRSAPQDAVMEVRRCISHLVASHPKRAPMIHRLGDKLTKALEALPATFAPTHGDLHAGNIITGEEIAFIDLSSFSLSDPLTDLGRFLAHLRAMSLRGRVPATLATKAEEVFLTKYFSGRPDSGRRVACLYQAAAMFTKVMVPFQQQFANWKEQVELRLAGAEHALRQALRIRA